MKGCLITVHFKLKCWLVHLPLRANVAQQLQRSVQSLLLGLQNLEQAQKVNRITLETPAKLFLTRLCGRLKVSQIQLLQCGWVDLGDPGVSLLPLALLERAFHCYLTQH